MNRGDEALLPRLDILELKFPERFEIYELDKHPLAALKRLRWATDPDDSSFFGSGHQREGVSFICDQYVTLFLRVTPL
ncbi:hypothetical protein E1B28_011850 [Marasmius oreades]|uniref:Uncharacterized protein n=1 Tax=Marasmius oreades TaxID=181124 RepID=A0A9P7RV54_9AGAR|nr:uncharacterized protein E1B28_011850 [Marasmius oreades]KAG7090252.1 hypothetical protein E1B28_011850 [Marasmius oreades]